MSWTDRECEIGLGADSDSRMTCVCYHMTKYWCLVAGCNTNAVKSYILWKQMFIWVSRTKYVLTFLTI